MQKIIILIVLFAFGLFLLGCNLDPDATYRVTYHSNGATYGYAPTDNNRYAIGEEAIVLDGHMLQIGERAFKNWNTKADGSGYSYVKDEKIIINGAVFLYAIFED